MEYACLFFFHNSATKSNQINMILFFYFIFLINDQYENFVAVGTWTELSKFAREMIKNV